MFTALGVSCGQAVWTLTASAGISAVLVACRSAFLTLKYLGAAYLLYLGLHALPGWLATTTRRKCLRVVNAVGRSGQRQAKLDEALQFAGDTAIDEEISLAERNAALLEAFAELPPHCQQLLSMLLADPPCSYAQISATLNIPVGSIGPQRARCLERLRRSNVLAAWGREARFNIRDAGKVPDSPDGR